MKSEKPKRNQLLPFGVFFVSMVSAGAVQAATCNPGTFSANGTDNPSSCTQAPPGSYVPNSGATAAILAQPGSFVPNSGSTAAFLAQPGSFVPNSGSTAAILAQPGSFVPNSGSTAAILAQPGSFVPNSGETGATLAGIGSYVPLSGSSTETLASPGYFVDIVGASTQTAAPVGFFVGSSGASVAEIAPAGTYISTSGQSSPTEVSKGFYTYAPGASEQVAAGLIAAPLNASILANEASLQAANALINTHSNDPIKMSTYYQMSAVDQIGQTSGGKQDISFWGLNFVGNTFGPKDEPGGFLAGISLTNYNASQDGNGNGFGFNLGAFKKLKLGTANLIGTLTYGSYDYDTTRSNISQGTVSGSNAVVQSATSSSRVNTYSFNLFGTVPLSQKLPGLEGFSNLAVSSYDFGGLNETAHGNNANPSAALNVASSNYLSIPLTIGLRYVVKDTTSQNPLMTVSVGYKYDFGSAKTLNFNSQSVSGYQFGVPVAMTNTNAFVMNVASSNYEIVKDLYLNATLSTELSGNYSLYQGTIGLIKRF